MPTSIVATRNKSSECFEAIQQLERMRKTCKFCAYSPIGTSNMATHVLCLHDKIKAIKGSRCLFSTASSSISVQHQKRIHSKIKINYKSKDKSCKYCGFSARKFCLVERHIKSVHDEIKDLKCSDCLYTASLKYHLVQHKKAIHQKIC